MLKDSKGHERKILAIVPARGGSKGVPRKNITLLGGLPIIAHTAITIKKCDFIDLAIVSTDDKKISEIAQHYGLKFLGFRPKELSGDYVGDAPVLKEALLRAEANSDVIFDIVIMLQPTSPVRQVNEIRSTVDKILFEGYDTSWTVSVTDKRFHPLKQLFIENGQLKFILEDGRFIVARQELSETYHRNGIAYALSREAILNGELLGQKAGVVVIDRPYANIDTLEDFKYAESLLRKESFESAQ